MSDHLGPAHPCLGCVHRGRVQAVKDRRNLPGNLCLNDKVPSAARHPVCWGDELPLWCPGKAAK